MFEHVQVFIYDPGLEWRIFASLIPDSKKKSRFVSRFTSSSFRLLLKPMLCFGPASGPRRRQKVDSEG